MVTISNGYNNYRPIRYIPDAIINHLMANNEIIWKLFKYNTPDALLKPNLSIKEKQDLIYTGFEWNGERWVLDESTDKAIWKQPFNDNINVEAQTMMHIFLSNIHPDDRVVGTAYYTIELITHMQCIPILSNLGDGNNEKSVTSENRIEVLTQQVLECLNGAQIGSIGRLFFDLNGGHLTKSSAGLYNNRNYSGNRIIFGCKINSIGDDV